ncbi:hypothetical protein NliqN6_0728 [Naganishia liquefaciens]|uniref:WD40 repeat-like protein n=1 Tax=Naganishia liquefaciens TaxID=104408 RepID=A0A8H3YE17_9TREE|nr:hypothetical protein NliqN6_0728 [Naganishia liquefaciens]
MQTDDASNLFQTDAALAKSDARRVKAERASKIGDPISLPSKVLALQVRAQDAWIAESGWVARRVNLTTGKAKKVFKGHQGPCTSLAILDCSGGDDILFTGSWDKTVRAWNAETGECISSTPAHTDFVKSLLLIPWLNILLSGGSDRQINLWDLKAFTASCDDRGLRKLKTLKEHTRPVEALALAEPGHLGSSANEAIFYSADSMGVIRSWLVKRDEDDVAVTMKDLFEGHHTSVPDLLIGEGGLWSASVDNQVLFHPIPRTQPPQSPTPIVHPDYVKSLCLLPSAFHPTAPLLLTGSVDEDIRVYDVSDILENASRGDDASAKEIANVKGHFGEVSSLKCWIKEGEGGKEPWVVSASLDGTLRRWSMKDILNPPAIPSDDEKPETPIMTEDEERELAELLASDDE